MRYLVNIFIALDQLLNTLLGGDPDETISSRIGKNYNGSLIHRTLDWIFKWQKKPQGHSEAAIEWDEGKNSLLR